MNLLGADRLRKLEAEYEGAEVRYFLPLDGRRLSLNALLGCRLRLRHTGAIFCIVCGRKTSRSFNRGYCYPCFRKLAQCDLCVLRPERCHYHQGTCREPEWGDAHCMIPHFVYLANTSGLKVGLTRCNRGVMRWIDQGAVQALPVFETDTRQQAGFVEVLFTEHGVSDRADWRRMLSCIPPPLDLYAERDVLLEQTAAGVEELRRRFGGSGIRRVESAEALDFHYPVQEYPPKVRSLNLDKTPSVEGCLQGVKGQYLIFDVGALNVGSFSGYETEWSAASQEVL